MKTATANINGIDTGALQQLMEDIKADHSKGIARFRVTSAWKGGTRTDTRIEAWELGGRTLPKDFTISIDEPPELLGANEYANPQEYLMAAMNACIMATYVAACSVNGIELDRLEVGDTRRAGSPRVPRPGRLRQAGLRPHRRHGPHQGRRDAGAVPADPRVRPEDLAQLLQHRPADHARAPTRGRVRTHWGVPSGRPYFSRDRQLLLS